MSPHTKWMSWDSNTSHLIKHTCSSVFVALFECTCMTSCMTESHSFDDHSFPVTETQSHQKNTCQKHWLFDIGHCNLFMNAAFMKAANLHHNCDSGKLGSTWPCTTDHQAVLIPLHSSCIQASQKDFLGSTDCSHMLGILGSTDCSLGIGREMVVHMCTTRRCNDTAMISTRDVTLQ